MCRNSAMAETIQKARQYAVSNSNVLILGESGTGKEMFAQSIHNASRFAQGPFVAINCAALPENLLESELYGYEEGAFTGAKKGGKPGLFELSHNGTLFLDEIGELPLRLQGKLLRSIQERCIYRVGGEKMIPITNRLICATNRDLWKNVEQGEFREDLYYRINVLQVHIPPLRERREDILPLARMLLQNKRKDSIPAAGELPDQVLEQMTSYYWPGNVRQLESFLERVVAVSIGGGMDAETFSHLFTELTEHSPNRASSPPAEKEPEYLVLRRGCFEEMERQIFQDAYHASGGCVQRVVEQLGLSRSTVWRKLKSFQIS